MTWRRGRLLAAVALLGGCSLQIPFECTWTLPVAATPGVATVEVAMNLADQEDLWSHRESIEDVRAETVGLRIEGVGRLNRADSVQLGLRYRPDLAPASGEEDLSVVAPIVIGLEQGSAVDVEAPAALGLAIREALAGSGRFTLVVSLEASRPVDAVVRLSLSGTAKTKP